MLKIYILVPEEAYSTLGDITPTHLSSDKKFFQLWLGSRAESRSVGWINCSKAVLKIDPHDLTDAMILDVCVIGKGPRWSLCQISIE